MTPNEVTVDARTRTVRGLPAEAGLPDRERLPTLLSDETATVSQHVIGMRSLRHLPVAAMPEVVAGTRTETRPLTVYQVIDVSPSNAWTDPDGARFGDFAYVSREWASHVIPNDEFALVLFDSTADMYEPCSPSQVPRSGFRELPVPNPLIGGTRFLPPAQIIAQHATTQPERATLAIFYSDGLPNDVNDISQASATLSTAGIPAVLIPYGPDFPWISPEWERTAFRVTTHVDDRRRAIAQTVALSILTATGHRRRH